ncbi:MAG: Ig-like domain-containing protein [Lachnospiraceae bacterium]
MKKTVRKLLCLFAVLCILAGGMPYTQAEASVITKPDEGVPAVTTEQGKLPLRKEEYRLSPLTYKGKASNYLLTQNPEFAGTTVYVSFDGDRGSVSTTVPAGTEGEDWFTIAPDNVLYTANVGGVGYFETNGNASDPLNNKIQLSNKKDSTVFVDPGTYYCKAVGYTSLTASGLALVGLGSADEVVIKKQPWQIEFFGVTQQYHERNLIYDNTLYQNITFDADNAGCLKTGAQTANAYTKISKDGGLTWQTSGTAIGSGRGGDFLAISQNDSGAVLIKNCTVRNIGTGQSGSANYAINIIAANKRQVNIEGVTISNCKGNGSSSYRLVNVGVSSNINFKDISFIQGSGNSVDALWIENPMSTTVTSADIPAGDIRFAGDVTFDGYPNKQRIGIQQTSYGNVTLPESYRYAVFSVGSISTVASGSTVADILAYKSLSDFTQTWSANDARSQFLVYDLWDNSWLVRSEGAPDVGAQLAGIQTVLQRMAAAYVPNDTNGSVGNSNGRGLVMDANIKIVANTQGSIPSFTVPAYSLAASAPNVHIRAVASTEELFTSAMGASTLVPLVAEGTIGLDNTGGANANVRLYNFDFHAAANYTMQEAIVQSKIANSEEATFIGCNFTVLAQAMTLSVPANIEADETDNDHEDTYTISVKTAPFTPTTAMSQAFSYQATGYEEVTPSDAFKIDDPSVAWSSSDTGIAEVDAATGLVTVKGTGEVTITANALDLYNQGEIDKPFVFFTLNIENYKTIFEPGAKGDWSIDPAGEDTMYYVTGLLDTQAVPGMPEVLNSTDSAWVFDTFIFDANGNGSIDEDETTEYSAADVIEGADRTYIATWKQAATPTVTPTIKPTGTPTVKPTGTPTVKPTGTPTVKPTGTVTGTPTKGATATPIAMVKDPTSKTGVKTGDDTDSRMVLLAVSGAAGIAAVLILRRKRKVTK